MTGAASSDGLYDAYRAGAGNVEKVVRGNQLKKFGDIDQLASNVRKEYNTKVKKYYQDYVQGTSVNKNGKIDFTNKGQREVLRWNPKQGQNFPELKNDIKSAKRMPDMLNNDMEKKYTDHFEVYRGKYGDHYIEHFKNNNRRYYITKDTPNSATHATSTDANRSATNIISKSMPKLKSPQEWLDDLHRQRSHLK